MQIISNIGKAISRCSRARTLCALSSSDRPNPSGVGRNLRAHSRSYAGRWAVGTHLGVWSRRSAAVGAEARFGFGRTKHCIRWLSASGTDRLVLRRRRYGSCRNDKGATAAVTRYGYGRGVFFEGCEPRCGEQRCTTISRRLRSAIGGEFVGKRSEPCPVSGCNRPEARVRSKPSEW